MGWVGCWNRIFMFLGWLLPYNIYRRKYTNVLESIRDIRGSKMFFFPGPKRANWKQTLIGVDLVFYLKDQSEFTRATVRAQIELSLGGSKSLGGSLKNLSPIHQSSSSQAEGTCFLFDILREPSGLVKPWLLGLHWGVRFSAGFLIGTWSAFPVYDVHWLRVNACKCIYLDLFGCPKLAHGVHGCFMGPHGPHLLKKSPGDY